MGEESRARDSLVTPSLSLFSVGSDRMRFNREFDGRRTIKEQVEKSLGIVSRSADLASELGSTATEEEFK